MDNRKEMFMIMGRKVYLFFIILSLIPLVHASETILFIQLEVYKNDTVILNNLKVMNGQPTPYIISGDYRLQLLNADKKVFIEKFIKINFLLMTEPPIPLNSSPLHLRVIYDPAMIYLRLLRNETEIFFKEINTCNENDLCESLESYLSCPSDCPLDSPDGICIKDKDGICDPDCIEDTDPDCIICGDGKCDQGETRENCCVDCGCIGGMKCQNGKCVKTEICGDEICSIHENYAKCKEDCPSGSKDNYCDKLEDDICDPDCSRTGDVDCLCNKNNVCESNFETNANCPEDCKSDFTLIYLILGLITLVSIIIFLKNHSKKTKWQEIYEETSN